MVTECYVGALRHFLPFVSAKRERENTKMRMAKERKREKKKKERIMVHIPHFNKSQTHFTCRLIDHRNIVPPVWRFIFTLCGNLHTKLFKMWQFGSLE